MRTYSDPALWEHSKEMARQALGGHSARAMQMAGKIYRAAGGRYIGKPTKAQQSLKRWTAQDWTTKSGRPSRETGERYLPRSAIEGLTSQEYAATTRAKRKGTAAGQQFVKQPKRIAAKVAAMKKATPAQLAARARFAEMVRSGAFKKKAKKAAPKRKTAAKTTSATYSVVSRDGAVEAKGLTLAAARKFIADKAKRTKRFAGYWSAVKTNPRKRTVSEKISQLMHEGYSQKQAVAVALSEQRAGKVKATPRKRNPDAPIKWKLYDRETRSQSAIVDGVEVRVTPLRDAQEAARWDMPHWARAFHEVGPEADMVNLQVPHFSVKEAKDPTNIKAAVRYARELKRDQNPATGRKASRTKLNPAAKPTERTVYQVQHSKDGKTWDRWMTVMYLPMAKQIAERLAAERPKEFVRVESFKVLM